MWGHSCYRCGDLPELGLQGCHLLVSGGVVRESWGEAPTNDEAYPVEGPLLSVGDRVSCLGPCVG